MDFKPQNVDIRLAASDTLPPGEQPVMLRCPMRERHNDSEKSLAVFPGNVHCFGCKFHITRRYESLAFLLGYWDGRGGCPSAAISRVRGEVHKYTHAALEAYRERVKETVTDQPIHMAVVRGFYMNLMANPSKLDYLRFTRDLSASIIVYALLGYDGGRFTIPVISAEKKVLNIRYRRDDTRDIFTRRGEEIPKYDGIVGHNGLFLYPLHILFDLSPFDTLHIVEGEFDALRLLSEGIPAVSPTNGAGQVKNVPQLLSQLDWMKSVSRIVILTDMDTPGHVAAAEVAGECDRLGYEWTRGTWDAGHGKDITEYLRGNRMEDIVYGSDIKRPESPNRQAGQR